MKMEEQVMDYKKKLIEVALPRSTQDWYMGEQNQQMIILVMTHYHQNKKHLESHTSETTLLNSIIPQCLTL